jgi:hypothetical protein
MQCPQLQKTAGTFRPLERGLQGVEGDRPKHAVEMRGKQRLEHLPQAVIMERGACEAGLEQG